jgi:hypothetical protein
MILLSEISLCQASETDTDSENIPMGFRKTAC